MASPGLGASLAGCRGGPDRRAHRHQSLGHRQDPAPPREIPGGLRSRRGRGRRARRSPAGSGSLGRVLGRGHGSAQRKAGRRSVACGHRARGRVGGSRGRRRISVHRRGLRPRHGGIRVPPGLRVRGRGVAIPDAPLQRRSPRGSHRGAGHRRNPARVRATGREREGDLGLGLRRRERAPAHPRPLDRAFARLGPVGHGACLHDVQAREPGSLPLRSAEGSVISLLDPAGAEYSPVLFARRQVGGLHDLAGRERGDLRREPRRPDGPAPDPQRADRLLALVQPDRAGDRLHLGSFGLAADLRDGRGRVEPASPDAGGEVQRLAPVVAESGQDRLRVAARRGVRRDHHGRERTEPGPDHVRRGTQREPALVGRRAKDLLQLDPLGEPPDLSHEPGRQRRGPADARAGIRFNPAPGPRPRKSARAAGSG